MATFLRIILLTFCGSLLHAQGILFFDGSWQDALTKAKQENKEIFLNAYTSWCAPCKRMEKEVFPDARLSAIFNEKYVNIRLDMEKGDGIALAKQYSIEAYPTLIFADADGNVLHRDAGFKSADQLLGLSALAGDENRRLSSWKTRFDSGERDSAFLYQYAVLLKNMYDKSYIEVAKAFLDTQQDWLSPSNMAFILSTADAAESDIFRFLVQHRQDFETQLGKDKITTYIDGVAQNYLTNVKSGVTIESARDILKLVYPEKAKRLSAAYPMTFYRQRGDRENYAKAAIEYFKHYHDDAGELSEAALTFSQVVANPAQLRYAVKWAKKADKLEGAANNVALIEKLNQKISDGK